MDTILNKEINSSKVNPEYIKNYYQLEQELNLLEKQNHKFNDLGQRMLNYCKELQEQCQNLGAENDAFNTTIENIRKAMIETINFYKARDLEISEEELAPDQKVNESLDLNSLFEQLKGLIEEYDRNDAESGQTVRDLEREKEEKIANLQREIEQQTKLIREIVDKFSKDYKSIKNAPKDILSQFENFLWGLLKELFVEKGFNGCNRQEPGKRRMFLELVEKNGEHEHEHGHKRLLLSPSFIESLRTISSSISVLTGHPEGTFTFGNQRQKEFNKVSQNLANCITQYIKEPSEKVINDFIENAQTAAHLHQEEADASGQHKEFPYLPWRVFLLMNAYSYRNLIQHALSVESEISLLQKQPEESKTAINNEKIDKEKNQLKSVNSTQAQQISEQNEEIEQLKAILAEVQNQGDDEKTIKIEGIPVKTEKVDDDVTIAVNELFSSEGKELVAKLLELQKSANEEEEEKKIDIENLLKRAKEAEEKIEDIKQQINEADKNLAKEKQEHKELAAKLAEQETKNKQLEAELEKSFIELLEPRKKQAEELGILIQNLQKELESEGYQPLVEKYKEIIDVYDEINVLIAKNHTPFTKYKKFDSIMNKLKVKPKIQDIVRSLESTRTKIAQKQFIFLSNINLTESSETESRKLTEKISQFDKNNAFLTKNHNEILDKIDDESNIKPLDKPTRKTIYQNIYEWIKKSSMITDIKSIPNWMEEGWSIIEGKNIQNALAFLLKPQAAENVETIISDDSLINAVHNAVEACKKVCAGPSQWKSYNNALERINNKKPKEGDIKTISVQRDLYELTLFFQKVLLWALHRDLDKLLWKAAEEHEKLVGLSNDDKQKIRTKKETIIEKENELKILNQQIAETTELMKQQADEKNLQEIAVNTDKSYLKDIEDPKEKKSILIKIAETLKKSEDEKYIDEILTTMDGLLEFITDKKISNKLNKYKKTKNFEGAKKLLGEIITKVEEDK